MPSGAPMRSAWPSCCRSGCARDGWQQTFDGVVTGLIGAGLFVRFGDIFEGFLPARRLDARERFDVDEHGVALVGRASGRRIRLGDELSCVVTAVDPPRGRATLDIVPDHDTPRRAHAAGQEDDAAAAAEAVQAQAAEAPGFYTPRVAEGERTIASNRKARHEYHILERLETGIALTGTEVKSLRAGKVALREAFATERGGELWLVGRHDRAVCCRAIAPITSPRATASCSRTATRSTSSPRGWPRRA